MIASKHDMLRRFPDVVDHRRATAERLANTIVHRLRRQAAETLVIRLDLAGVALSARARPARRAKSARSHVLRAMGIAPEIARGAIRISLGPTTTDDDIAAFLAASETILRTAAKAA